MPWCPKCESEFEPHVHTCPVCEVPLVESLDDVVRYTPLITIPTDEVDRLLEYLKFSGYETIQVDEDGEEAQISIPQEQETEIRRILGIYLYQRQQEINEEEASEEDEEGSVGINTPQRNRLDGQKIEEMKSSVWSFLVLGGILAAVGILNLTGIMTFLSIKSMVYMCVVVGLAFVAVGIVTWKRIPYYQSQLDSQDENIRLVKSWFMEAHGSERFLENQDIDKTVLDEGALYFAVSDRIKNILKDKYPDMDEVVLTSAADELVNNMLK